MATLFDVLLPLGCAGCSANCEVIDARRPECKKTNDDDDNHETGTGLVGS